MRLFKQRILFVIVFSMLFIVLSSCSSKAKTVEITYDSKGGTSVNTVINDIDEPLILPNNPLKEGYTFDGWYLDDKTFKIPFSNNYDLNLVEGETLTVFAKWNLITYRITFNTNDGTFLIPITHSILFSNINRPTDPSKEGYTFDGWYLDNDFTISYSFDSLLYENITLHAKWEPKVDENEHLATDMLPISSSLYMYGNIDGNLNNQGLAVYDINRMLHYVSHLSSVYSYDPSSDETTLLFTLPSGGRATFLNMDGDILYFINSDEGHLLSYHLINKNFTTISETKNIYASRNQSWVNFIYHTIIYGQDRIAYQRYIIKDKSLSSIEGYGFEPIGNYGTRVYYKPTDSLGVSVMHYSGIGKATVVNLEPLGVTNQFESLLYYVDYDYESYFALVLEIGESPGLYLYNSNDGLVKVMNGKVHSLNYDGEFVYAIYDGGLYQINLDTKTPEMIYTLSSSDTNLNIINNWFYIGSYESLEVYRINPVTKEAETIFD